MRYKIIIVDSQLMTNKRFAQNPLSMEGKIELISGGGVKMYDRISTINRIKWTLELIRLSKLTIFGFGNAISMLLAK
jgi:hypothetical protein